MNDKRENTAPEDEHEPDEVQIAHRIIRQISDRPAPPAKHDTKPARE